MSMFNVIKYRKDNAGFTLIETLLVVAIIVVLMAVSFVGIAGHLHSLKITELDNAAREIYMAAQNRASLLKSSYRLDGLLSSAGGGAENLPLGVSATGTVSENCYYINSKDDPSALADLLPVGSIDPALQNGQFTIVYEPKSGSVTDVFYVEKGVMPDVGIAFSKAAAGRDARMEYDPMLGWYGSGMAVEIETRPLSTPGVEALIENGDELILTVRYTLPADLPDGIKRTPNVTLEYPGVAEKTKLLTVDDTGAQVPFNNEGQFQTPHSDIQTALPGATVEYQWVLDSLRDKNKMFRNLLPGYEHNYNPAVDEAIPALGKDFTVTAELTLSTLDDDGYIDSFYSTTVKGNSLFDTGTTEDTAMIANLRHLQNLDNAYSWAAGKETAVQIADVSAGDYMGSPYSFIPIQNWDLKKYQVNSPASGAEPYSIRRLNATTAAAEDFGLTGVNAGLFSGVKDGFIFENVRLYEANVAALGSTHAGALVGTAPNAEFINCWVFDSVVTANDANGGSAGGLAGCWWKMTDDAGNIINDAPIQFSECKVQNTKITSFNSAGGLVGGGPNAKFTSCTVIDAEITATGWADAGGLVGHEDGGATFEGCTVADTTVSSNGSAAGGLAGGAGATTNLTYAKFNDCSVNDVEVKAVNYAGGLVGSLVAASTKPDELTGCSTKNATVSVTGNWSDAGGLVGRAIYAKFRNCKADGAVVAGKSNVGGLAGYGSGIEMIECETMGAFATAIKHAGGLIGTAEGGVTLSKCKVWENDPSHLTGFEDYRMTAEIVGGLAGYVKGGGTITDSLAATLIYGKTYADGVTMAHSTICAGGLVGMIDGASSNMLIAVSYADCYIKAGPATTDFTAYASGLVGMKNTGVKLRMKNVYAAGFIRTEGPPQANGLCGGWVEEVAKADMTAENAYAAIHYEFAGSGYPLMRTADLGCATNCYFMESNWGWTNLTFEQMKNLPMGAAFAPKDLGSSHPYNVGGGARSAYPFPGLVGLDHYGDWYE